MTDYRGPHFKALQTWAQARGLTVQASNGSQREPEHVVSLVDGDPAADGAVLLTKTSLDSIDTAALYLIDVIERLREEPRDEP